MKNIEIDDTTYVFLQKEAIPFEEQPGDTLKRLLGLLDKKQEEVSENNSVVHFTFKEHKKQKKVHLPTLIREAVLSPGQKLFFIDYQGNRHSEYEVYLSSNCLVWKNREYSMSDLASRILKELGYASPSVRGPIYWVTEEGKSIHKLWQKYLSKSTS